MRVLILEDEEFMAKHVEQSLRGAFPDIEIVWTTQAGEALGSALEMPFDCLIFDRMVEGGDGLDVLGDLRQRGIETPAVILSNLNELEHRIDGLEGGADDYLGKNFEVAELVARVRAAMRRGSTQGHPQILKFDNLELHRAAEVAEWRGQNLKLKPKEFQLLLRIVEGHPNAVSYDQVWKAAWPEMKNLSPQKAPIHTTMSRLRERLNLAPGVTILAEGGGYKLDYSGE